MTAALPLFFLHFLPSSVAGFLGAMAFSAGRAWTFRPAARSAAGNERKIKGERVRGVLQVFDCIYVFRAALVGVGQWRVGAGHPGPKAGRGSAGAVTWLPLEKWGAILVFARGAWLRLAPPRWNPRDAAARRQPRRSATAGARR